MNPLIKLISRVFLAVGGAFYAVSAAACVRGASRVLVALALCLSAPVMAISEPRTRPRPRPLHMTVTTRPSTSWACISSYRGSAAKTSPRRQKHQSRPRRNPPKNPATLIRKTNRKRTIRDFTLSRGLLY